MENSGITLQHSLEIPSSPTLTLTHYLIIFPFAWVVTRFSSLNGVIRVLIPFLTSHQIILSDLFKTWNLISTYLALLFSSTYNSAVPYGHTESPGGKTWNLIQSIKYVEIFLPKAWCLPFTRSFLNTQKKLCNWIVAWVRISQWHLPQSIGP